LRRFSAFSRAHRGLALVLGGAICLQWMLGGVFPLPAAAFLPNFPRQGASIFLPLVIADYMPPEGRLCRFGVGAPTNIADYPVNGLRIGWYTNWGSSLKPARPGGIEYLQMVHLAQTGPATYTSSPTGSSLLATIAANPGALWVIGNEPDRRAVQDDLEPQVYAIAYHDLYYQIKNADPASRIVAGSIVQPTPLRLQYLDMVLQSYRTRYGGEQMPVDVWNIHAFILQEKSCNASCPYDPDCGWGAGIPPGISDCTGKTYTIEQNDDLAVFKQFIVDFRQWMAKNNYQDRPLIITEFGVLMPPDYGSPPFGPPRVNAFMNATFDYLSTAAGPLGYAADKGRLVQGWAWYSLTDRTFNGWLFDSSTKARTAYGENFAAYTAGVKPHVNLTPVKVSVESRPPSVTLVASVANNGNVEFPATAVVRFYDGDPGKGGVQIGSDQLLPPVNGCANTASVRTPWTNATPGTATVWVVVDPQNAVTESDEGDNRLSAPVVVPL
jgi:CARDB